MRVESLHALGRIVSVRHIQHIRHVDLAVATFLKDVLKQGIHAANHDLCTAMLVTIVCAKVDGDEIRTSLRSGQGFIQLFVDHIDSPARMALMPKPLLRHVGGPSEQCAHGGDVEADATRWTCFRVERWLRERERKRHTVAAGFLVAILDGGPSASEGNAIAKW